MFVISGSEDGSVLCICSSRNGKKVASQMSTELNFLTQSLFLEVFMSVTGIFGLPVQIAK